MSLGNYYYRLNNYRQAAFYFDKALKKEPDNAKAHFLKGRSNHMIGKTKQALEDYNKALSIDDQFGEAYLYRGAIRAHSRNFKKACSDFEIAAKLDVEGASSAVKRYCN